MKTEMTYDELNELTHGVADSIDSAVDGDLNRCNVNDMLTAFLSDRGITFVEEDEDGPWHNNELQFARLLCEIVAANGDLNFHSIMASMNLGVRELHDLFARAEKVWEDAKEKITS